MTGKAFQNHSLFCNDMTQSLWAFVANCCCKARGALPIVSFTNQGEQTWDSSHGSWLD